MPFKFTPHSVLGTLEVLRTASRKNAQTTDADRAISQETATKVVSTLAMYENEIGERDEQFAMQANATAAETKQKWIVKTYASHFFQVLNLAIERGEYSASDRRYYGLDINYSQMPALRSEAEIIEWAKKIVVGEANRLSAPGRNTDTNISMQKPSAKQVETELNKFITLSDAQMAERAKFDKENKDVLDMLPEINELIRDIYDEVEFFYRKESPSNKRKLSRDWGVVYYTRSGEQEEQGCITEEELNQM